MSIQFIACTADSCPLNELRQCRAPWIAVDAQGKCMLREIGPHDNKSETEKYVDLKECQCTSCNHYEVDKVTDMGDCGLGEDLFFKMIEGKGPFCHAFHKQVDKTPAFSTTV